MRSASVLLGIALLFVLTACGPGSSSDSGSGLESSSAHLKSDSSILKDAEKYDGEKLTVMVPEPLNKWFAAGTKTFEDKTGVTVKFEVTPFDQLVGKYSTLAAGQDASADVFYSWSAITAQMGPLLFQDLTEPLKGLSAQYTKGSLSSMQSGGKTYGLPYMTSLQIMYFNKALFTAAGLDPQQPPQSWAEFIKAGKALTGGGKYGFVTSGQTANDVFAGLWLPAFNSAGGTMYSSDLKKVTVDTDAGLKAMNALSELGASGSLAPATWGNNGSQDAAISFAAGNVGMTFNFPLAYPIIADPAQSKMQVDDVGLALIPGVQMRSGSVDGSEGLAISRYSKNKDLALDYIAYITGPTVQKALALGDEHTVPSRSALLKNPKITVAIPVAPTVKEQAAYPASRAGAAFYNDAAEVVGKVVRNVIEKGADPKSSLSTMQSRLQKLVDNYWADNG